MRIPVLSDEVLEMDTSSLAHSRVTSTVNNNLQNSYQMLRSVLNLHKSMFHKHRLNRLIYLPRENCWPQSNQVNLSSDNNNLIKTLLSSFTLVGIGTASSRSNDYCEVRQIHRAIQQQVPRERSSAARIFRWIEETKNQEEEDDRRRRGRWEREI